MPWRSCAVAAWTPESRELGAVESSVEVARSSGDAVDVQWPGGDPAGTTTESMGFPLLAALL